MSPQVKSVGLWTVEKRVARGKNIRKKMATDPSLPLIQKIIDPNYKLHFKIFWIVAIVCCFGLCFYQIGYRIQNYIQEPTTIKLEMRRLTEVHFPSIVICSSALTNVMKDWYDKYIACKHDISTCDDVIRKFMFKSYKDRNTTLEKQIRLLSEINRTDIEFSNHCPLFADQNEICDGISVETEMNLQNIDTIWGYCLVLTLKSNMEYRGPFTWISLSWNNSMFSWNRQIDGTEPTDYYYFFQPNVSALSRHDAIYLTETLELGYETTVRISAREFHFLNSKKRPCTDDLSAITCFEKCVDNLLAENLSCRIPILKSGNLSMCSTIRDTIGAYANSDSIYTTLKSSSCRCIRRCVRIVYKVSVDGKVELTNNQTKFKLLYSDDTLEVLTEVEIFSFSELVSEIGGTIGLYLGICFFTVFELVESLLKRFTRCC